MDNSTCVSDRSLCNGYEECKDGSDEDPAICSTCPGKFKCLESGECVSLTTVCDSRINCNDGSDELDCNSWQCPNHYWKCADNVELL